MSFINSRLSIFSEINPLQAKKLLPVDVIKAVVNVQAKALAYLRNGKDMGFREHILIDHITYLQYFELSHVKLCIEENYQIIKKKYPAESKKVFVKIDFEHYLPRLKQLKSALHNNELQLITSYKNFDFYYLEIGLSSYTFCWKAVSRDSYIFYEEYLNDLINYLEKEFLENDTSSQLAEQIPKIELFTSNKSEKIVYLEQLGVLDFLKGKEPFNTSTNALAQAVSHFTGIKPGTVQSYLNPMNNSDLNQKNNPLTNKRLEKIKKELLTLGFKPD